MSDIANDPIQRYDRLRTGYLEAVAKKTKQLTRVTAVAGVFLFLFLAPLLVQASGSSTIVWLVAAIGVTATVYVGLLARSRIVREILHLSKLLENICIYRSQVERDWENIPFSHVDVSIDVKTVADDLALFGERSLFHLVNRCHTQDGLHALRDIFCEGISRSTPSRQSVIRELSRFPDEIVDFLGWSSELRFNQLSDASGSRWAAPSSFLCRISLIWIAVALCSVTGCCFAMTIESMTSETKEMIGITLLVLGVMHLLSMSMICGKIHEHFSVAALGAGPLCACEELFGSLSRLCKNCPSLSGQIGISPDSLSAAIRSLRHLSRIASHFRLCRYPAFWFPVQVLTLWDCFLLLMLKRWHAKHSDALFNGIDKIGMMEAYCSLAGFATDNPEWCFPEFVSNEPGVLEAVELAHPLQRAEVRVPSSVTFGPPGSILLITGSNMSGKSTFLRAIGTNILLAQIGSAVCAREFRASHFHIASSINVNDSLANHESLFLAELKRLKTIVQCAQAAHGRGETVLCLLDEILHGTNSYERRIAVKIVLKLLSSFRSTSLVTTHDFELAKEMDHIDGVTNLHFRELETESEILSFEYILRKGISPSVNALRLLKALRFPLIESVSENDPFGN